MSYCRWSSEDFMCDLYVYESIADSFVVHVAASKIIPAEPMPPRLPDDKFDPEAYLARHREVSRIYSASERVKIGLPYDGETHTFSSAAACLEFMLQLRALGYRVPDYAIEAMRHKAASDPAH